MSPENCDELPGLGELDIQKQYTVSCEAVPARMKLVVTICFVSTGSNYADLKHLFRIHKITLSKFIPEVWKAL